MCHYSAWKKFLKRHKQNAPVYRLIKVPIHSGTNPIVPINVGNIPANTNNWNRTHSMVSTRPHLSRNFKAANAWQINVYNHTIYMGAIENTESLIAVGCLNGVAVKSFDIQG